MGNVTFLPILIVLKYQILAFLLKMTKTFLRLSPFCVSGLMLQVEKVVIDIIPRTFQRLCWRRHLFSPNVRESPLLCLPQGHPGDTDSPACGQLVQSLGFQDLHFGLGHGRTAASHCLPLCLTLWTFCPSNSFLNSVWDGLHDSIYLLFGLFWSLLAFKFGGMISLLLLLWE